MWLWSVSFQFCCTGNTGIYRCRDHIALVQQFGSLHWLLTFDTVPLLASWCDFEMKRERERKWWGWCSEWHHVLFFIGGWSLGTENSFLLSGLPDMVRSPFWQAHLREGKALGSKKVKASGRGLHCERGKGVELRLYCMWSSFLY
jgi:hypothetical protein